MRKGALLEKGFINKTRSVFEFMSFTQYSHIFPVEPTNCFWLISNIPGQFRSISKHNNVPLNGFALFREIEFGKVHRNKDCSVISRDGIHKLFFELGLRLVGKEERGKKEKGEKKKEGTNQGQFSVIDILNFLVRSQLIRAVLKSMAIKTSIRFWNMRTLCVFLQKLQNGGIANLNTMLFNKKLGNLVTEVLISEKLESIIRARFNWHYLIQITHQDISQIIQLLRPTPFHKLKLFVISWVVPLRFCQGQILFLPHKRAMKLNHSNKPNPDLWKRLSSIDESLSEVQKRFFPFFFFL